jgi:hypothetical protein
MNGRREMWNGGGRDGMEVDHGRYGMEVEADQRRNSLLLIIFQLLNF